MRACTLVIAERFNFNHSDQTIGESLEEFKAVLKKLPTCYSFGAHHNEVFKDIFLAGNDCRQNDPNMAPFYI